MCGLGSPNFNRFMAMKTSFLKITLETPLVAQMVNSPSSMQTNWVQPLGQEDPLEEGIAIHSSILAWRLPWTEKPGGLLQSMGSHESDTTE